MDVQISKMVIEVVGKDNASNIVKRVKGELQTLNKTTEKLPNDVLGRFNDAIGNINTDKLVTSNEKVKQAIVGVQKSWNSAQNAAQSYNQALERQSNALGVLQSLKTQGLQGTEQYTQAEFKLSQAQQAVIKSGRMLENSTLSLENNKRRLINVNKEASKTTEEYAKKKQNLNSAFKTFSLAKMFSIIYMTRRLKNIMQEAITVSAAWVENLNLLEVTFKETSEAGMDFVKTMSQIFGLDPNRLAEYSATFMQMANAMGQARDTAFTMSTALTQVALDLSSLRNVGFGQAISDFSSAIAGQVKPVRKYGLDITAFSIDELMRDTGIPGTAIGMRMIDKQLARTILLLEQSRDAWGDYAKTINTFANQQKILTAQMTQFQRAIGDLLVGTFDVNQTFEEASKSAGVATRLIWHLNGSLMALTSILRVFNPESFSSGMNQTTNSIKDFNEEMEDALEQSRGMLASFDKFETLSRGDQNEGVTALLEGLLQAAYGDYLSVYNQRLAEMDSFAENIKNNILGWVFPNWNAELKTFEDYINKLKFPNWDKELETLEDYLDRTGDKAVSVFTNMNGAIRLALFSMNALVGIMVTKKLAALFSLDGAALQASKSFTLLSKAMTFVAKNPWIIAIGLIVGLMIHLYQTNEEFRESVQRLFAALNNLFGSVMEPLMDLIIAFVPLLEILSEILVMILVPIINFITLIVDFLNYSGILKGVIYAIIGLLIAVGLAFKFISLSALPVVLPIIAIIAAIGLLIYIIVSLVRNWDKVVESFKNGWDLVVRAFTNGFNFIKENVFQPIVDFFTAIWDWLQKIGNGIKDVFGGIGKFGGELLGKVGIDIQGFATGGFPQSGQIFMANENGKAEMIGGFGNRTAVANNDQIVEGIQQGVFSAVVSALQQSSGIFQSKGGDVYIDSAKAGRVLAKGVFAEGQRVGYMK